MTVRSVVAHPPIPCCCFCFVKKGMELCSAAVPVAPSALWDRTGQKGPCRTLQGLVPSTARAQENVAEHFIAELTL